MTINSDCNKLDAYLADDLPAGEALRFESHLEECGACREAIDEQRWVDSLLQSPVRIQIERAPAELLDSFHSSLPQRRRHVVQAACGLAAAAVLVIALGWLQLNRQAKQPSIAKGQDVAVAKPVQEIPSSKSQATFVASTDAIVVPLESSSADVTIVQVYQTTDTERRWRLEQSLLNASTKSNGG
jgi:anti-sigma factor RsiW